MHNGTFSSVGILIPNRSEVPSQFSLEDENRSLLIGLFLIQSKVLIVSKVLFLITSCGFFKVLFIKYEDLETDKENTFKKVIQFINKLADRDLNINECRVLTGRKIAKESKNELKDKLNELKSLVDEGLITEKQYQEKSSKLLDEF